MSRTVRLVITGVTGGGCVGGTCAGHFNKTLLLTTDECCQGRLNDSGLGDTNAWGPYLFCACNPLYLPTTYGTWGLLDFSNDCYSGPAHDSCELGAGQYHVAGWVAGFVGNKLHVGFRLVYWNGSSDINLLSACINECVQKRLDGYYMDALSDEIVDEEDRLDCISGSYTFDASKITTGVAMASYCDWSAAQIVLTFMGDDVL